MMLLRRLIDGPQGPVRVRLPIPEIRDVTLVRGDSYFSDDARAIIFDLDEEVVNLAGSTVTLRAVSRATGAIGFEAVGAVFDSATVAFELTSETTATLELGDSAYSFDVSAVTPWAGHTMTLAVGLLSVIGDVR